LSRARPCLGRRTVVVIDGGVVGVFTAYYLARRGVSVPLPEQGRVAERGFSGYGFGIGTGAGHMIADIITGSEPIVDPVLIGPSI
jgi:glycine/D-amino acid oxidase-like deaminating enzyme